MIFDDLGLFLTIFKNHDFLMISSTFTTSVTWRRVLRTPSLSKKECPKLGTGAERPQCDALRRAARALHSAAYRELGAERPRSDSLRRARYSGINFICQRSNILVVMIVQLSWCFASLLYESSQR